MIWPLGSLMLVGTLSIAKLIMLSSAEGINLLMSQKVKQLVVRLSHLLILRLPKQIWEQLVNLHLNLHQVRQESLLVNQELHQHPLQRQPQVRNPLNLPRQLKKAVLSLPLRLNDREEIRRFKNNPLIIKFLAQALLAVRKPHRFSSRSRLKLARLSCLNRIPLRLEQDKQISQLIKSLPRSLSFNSRKASYLKKHLELGASCTWLMRLLMISLEVSIALS